MMFHEYKHNIKKHFGFNAVYTTPIKLKTTQNIGVLSSINGSMCIPARSQASRQASI